jgi:tetratricopeptide (TPR) repeat protein
MAPAFSQTTSTGTSGTGSTSTGTGSKASPSLPTLGTTPTTTTVTPQPQPSPIPITVSGRVMRDDGTPAPVNTVLERVCSGTPHGVGFTDGQGYFSVRLGGESLAALEDASESSSFSRTFGGTPASGTGATTSSGTTSNGESSSRLSSCELRARLAGYRSQSIPLNDRKALDNPDVGVILIHRLAPNEGASTVTTSSLQAPKNAKKAFQKGLDLLKKKKTDDAAASFHEAVDLFPQYAEAWFELGKLQGAAGHPDDARHSFETAAQAEPRWTDPLLELSLVAMYEHNWPEVVDFTNRVLVLNSFSYPQAFYFNAVANYNLKHLDVAEKAARSAQKLDVRHEYPETAFILGNILIAHHQYADAAVEFRAYLALAPTSPDAVTARKQLDGLDRMANTAAEVAHKDQQR